MSLDVTAELPRNISRSDQPELECRLAITISASLNGAEARKRTGGLRYDDVETVDEVVATGPVRRVHRRTCHEYSVRMMLGPMVRRLICAFRPNSPYLDVALELGSQAQDLGRNLTIDIDVDGGPCAQSLHAPGGAVHRGANVEQHGDEPFGVSRLGGLRGPSALIGVEEDGAAIIVRPTQEAEIPVIVLIRQGGGADLDRDESRSSRER